MSNRRRTQLSKRKRDLNKGRPKFKPYLGQLPSLESLLKKPKIVKPDIKKKTSGAEPKTNSSSKDNSFSKQAKQSKQAKLISNQIDIPSYLEFIKKDGKYLRSDLAHYKSNEARQELIKNGVLYSSTVEEAFIEIANTPPENRVAYLAGSLDQDQPPQEPDTLYLASDASLKPYHVKSSNEPLKFNVNYFGFALSLNGKVKTIKTKHTGKSANDKYHTTQLELLGIQQGVLYLQSAYLQTYSNIKQAVIYTDQQSFIEVLNSHDNKWKNLPAYKDLDVKRLVSNIITVRDVLETQGLKVVFKYTKSHKTNYLHNLIDRVLTTKQEQYARFVLKKLRNPYYKPRNSERTCPDIYGRPTK